ncbi:MAG: ATP-binding protein [Kineosporiaceae bacterium]|nr:ATP-binding protein [Kineosporiaceae bacterium]
MLPRANDRDAILRALRRSPVVLLVGARQTGKTTLARTLVEPSSENYFDAEDPIDLARLDDPMLALRHLTGLVVIDEVQRRPDLFPSLRVLADREDSPAHFLVLGSASPTALRQSAESLAGRVEVLELGGLSLHDVGIESSDRLWLRGGFPRSLLAADEESSQSWRRNYVRTLAVRDLRDFGLGLPPSTIERFLALLAHYHGQLWNSAEPARVLGISDTTVRRYIDALQDALLVRVLQPWHANIDKRQVRSPKVYLRDSGLAHTLLGIDSWTDLVRHPRIGATWEGMVIEECVRQATPGSHPYFWRTSNGAELDLLLVHGDRRIGIEVKRADSPRMTPSMRHAMTDLELDELVVYYPGPRSYRLADQVRVEPISSLA